MVGRTERNSRYAVSAGAFLLAIVASTGCSDGRPELVPLSGRVLIDGKPLETGYIRILPKGKRAASGKLGPGGIFSISTYDSNDGVVAGKHAVTVIALEPINAQTQKWHAPKKYAAVATSGLEIDASEPTDAAEINLSWDSGAPFIERIEGNGD